MGAIAGKRLSEYILKEIDLKIKEIFIWSDSKVVLNWILISNQEKQPIFIKRRIEEIRKSPEIKWKYVPTELNIADIATRGTNCEDLKVNKCWWQGPAFLREEEKAWPKAPELDKIIEVKEIKAEFIMTIRKEKIIDLNTRNEWSKLIGIGKNICTALKIFTRKIELKTPFLNAIKSSESKANLRKLGEIFIIIESQLQNKPTEKEIFELYMRKNKYGVWLCPGRIENAGIPTPVFVSYDSPIAETICMEAHKRAMHSGLRQSLCEMRRSFWIVKGRQKMRNTINKCLYCRKMNSKPFEIPKMPVLPEERLKKSSPFKNCGLDYAGPFQVKSENKIIKVWIEVFTCLSTRFSHLELIKDLSANSCVQAFRRFVAEYGKPSHVISDNGTQYRLTQKVINEIERKIEGEKINWRFIPAVSPWFGGVYEAII
uniref:Integrase catalytic domain-containing protein n=2 Tax=Meloidogyne enterolobii TaxID=390850 RepID=A0A6V7YAG3_MELEN|nr:unnamed protein product [Meloidogyne enterolobii]